MGMEAVCLTYMSRLGPPDLSTSHEPRALELLGRISDAASAADKAAKAARLKDSGGRALCEGGGDTAGLDLPHQPVVRVPGRSCGWRPADCHGWCPRRGGLPRCGEPVPQPLPFLGAGTHDG